MERSFRSIFTALALAALLLVPLGSSAQASEEREGTRTVVELSRKSGPGDAPAERARTGPAPFSDSIEERKNRLPAESGKRAKERLELAKKMNSSARARMGAQAAEIDIIDCQNSQYSYSATGFVIDHFSWCQAGYYSVTIKRCGTFGCSDIGKAYFRLTTIGYGTDGSRKIEFVTLMDELKMTGDVAQVSAQTLQLSMGCTAYLEATCTKDPNNGRTDTIAGWQNVPSAFFRFTSPLEGTSGLEQISWYDFQQTLTLVNSGDSVDMGGNAFRCDSATYVNNPGCVFDLVNELWYDLSISNPEVDETAQHIYDAQYRPEFTFPWFEGKTVPGSIDSAEPLSRVFHDLSLRRANHRTAVSTCKKVYGDDYATKGLDCDEYPFQSTYQGAAAGDNRYSARALTSTDNQKAGSMLSSWYGSQRILDGDHFFVIINS